MVMGVHNDSVNARSRSDIDSNANHHPFVKVLRVIAQNLEAIQHKIEGGQIDIDQYLSEPGSGTITLSNPTRQPWKLTDIVATFPTASTSVTIKIKDRVLTIPATQGFFSMTGMHGIQMGFDDKVILTIAPAAACFMEIQGMSDFRKIERLGNE